MQIVKTKQRIPIFDLLLGLGLLALGVVILILPIYDLEDIFLLLFALLMFGPVLEREWGERKYLIYYFV